MKRRPYIKPGRQQQGMKGDASDRLWVSHDDVAGLRTARTRKPAGSVGQLETPKCIRCRHYMGNHHPQSGCFVVGCDCG